MIFFYKPNYINNNSTSGAKVQNKENQIQESKKKPEQEKGNKKKNRH